MKLLLPATILAVIFVYFFGIKKTIDIRSEIISKEEKLKQSKDVDGKINLIQTKIKAIDNIVGNNLDSSKNVMDMILENITTYCNSNNCTLRAIPEIHRASDNNFDIDTYFITVEGNYKQLLNLVYELEQKKKSGGRLSSCLFFTKKNNTTKKLSLELTLFIQQYNKK